MEYLKKIDYKNRVSNTSEMIKKNTLNINNYLKLKNKTYENFILSIENDEEILSDLITPYFNLNSVNNNEDTEKTTNELIPILSEYETFVSQNKEIYDSLLEIKEKEYINLTDIKQKVLDDMIEGYEISGIQLEKKLKDRLKDINLKLSQLSQDFSQNVIKRTNEFEMILNNEEMDGIPENDKELYKIEDNKYKMTLQYPSYICYMTYAKNRVRRKELSTAYVNRAPQNGKLIEELLSLKDEKAKILGFENYREYSIKVKSAPSVNKVIETIETLGEHSIEKANLEWNEVVEFANNLDGIEDVKPYDFNYYSEKIKEKEYSINEEEYKPYFEKNNVVKGLFNFINKIWNIEFKEIEELSWNEKVKTFKLYKENKEIAKLYMDLESREGKSGGAWMNNWHSKTKDSNPSRFVVCNFSPSNEEKDLPSLLRHDDVVTLFHEMGHALHHLLTQVEEPSVGGINVDWDVVEFPSQFLEYFSFEDWVLKEFGKHYKTNETIPQNMIDNLKKARNFQSAYFTTRQVEFRLFDLSIHDKSYNEEEVQLKLDSIRDKYIPYEVSKENKFQNSFTHIFRGGYSRGYYSYKWAEILSATAFIKYMEGNEEERKTFAKNYNNIINGSGGSKKMDTLFQELVGEEPNVDSLLKIDGII